MAQRLSATSEKAWNLTEQKREAVAAGHLRSDLWAAVDNANAELDAVMLDVVVVLDRKDDAPIDPSAAPRDDGDAS